MDVTDVHMEENIKKHSNRLAIYDEKSLWTYGKSVVVKIRDNIVYMNLNCFLVRPKKKVSLLLIGIKGRVI